MDWVYEIWGHIQSCSADLSLCKWRGLTIVDWVTILSPLPIGGLLLLLLRLRLKRSNGKQQPSERATPSTVVSDSQAFYQTVDKAIDNAARVAMYAPAAYNISEALRRKLESVDLQGLHEEVAIAGREAAGDLAIMEVDNVAIELNDNDASFAQSEVLSSASDVATIKFDLLTWLRSIF